MNKPTNVFVKGDATEKELAQVSTISYEFGRAQGKDGEIQVEYANSFKAGERLDDNVIEASAETHISIIDKDGEVYNIDSRTGKVMIFKGQDVHKAMKVEKMFNEAIKPIGLKTFTEMLNVKKHVKLGYDNIIDPEQIKELVEEYLQEEQSETELR